MSLLYKAEDHLDADLTDLVTVSTVWVEVVDPLLIRGYKLLQKVSQDPPQKWQIVSRCMS